MKPLLIQCALAAIKDKTCQHFGSRYERIKHRRGHKRAVIAIARMLLTIIYHCLKNGEFFDPSKYSEHVGLSSASSHDVDVSHLFNQSKRLGYTLVLSGA